MSDDLKRRAALAAKKRATQTQPTAPLTPELEKAKLYIEIEDYDAARALLAKSTDPRAMKLLARLNEKYPPVTESKRVTGTQPKAKPGRSLGRSCAYGLVVIGALACGGVALLYYILNMPVDGLPRNQYFDRMSLEMYCDYAEVPQDCKAWANEAVRADPIAAGVCVELYGVYSETDDFSHCLVGLGLSPVPGRTVVDDVEISDWTIYDYRVIDKLSAYCDGEHNRHYCAAWSWLMYRDYRNEIWGCSQQYNDQVGFTNCVIGFGIKA